MKTPPLKQSSVNYSSQTRLDKTPSDFWKAVRNNIKLQHQLSPIKPVPRNGKLPLSFNQERLWFIDQLLPGSSLHNMSAAFRLTGSLNVAALEKSLGEIVRRHESLRTAFRSVDGQPVQVIYPEVALKMPVEELCELPPEYKQAEVQRLATKEGKQPFDLARVPLWRFKLLRLAEEEYVLLRTIHHVVFDRWSSSVFMRELAVIYEAFSTGKPSPLPELSIQYADFAQSQREWLQDDKIDSLLDYWKQETSGSISLLKLPTDYQSPRISNHQGACQYLTLSTNLTEALKKLSHQEGVSLFVTLLSAFKVLLYRYTGQEDMIVCSPMAGRNRVETKKLIGYFNNIVVLRTNLSGNPSFRELVGQVSRAALGAYEHQNLPFQKLAELPSLARTPLNRAMFMLQNTPSQPLELADITMTPVDLDWRTTDFDFSLSMHEKGKQLTGVLKYKRALFDAATITQMLERFQTLLESIVASPEQHIESLPSLKKTEIYKAEPLTPAPDKRVFVAPRDELELKLAKIWEKVLGIEPIGVKDNFFELGGHSILAPRLFVEIEKKFSKNLPLATLFQAPTVEQLASIIREEGFSAPCSSLVLLQSGGAKPPLFFSHGVGGNTLRNHILTRLLGSERPIYGFQARGSDGIQAPLTRIEDMVASYVKEMQTVQPKGPYFLFGFCFSGYIAYEMARELQARGEKVALLAILDAKSPTLLQTTFYASQTARERVDYHRENLAQAGFKGKISYVLGKIEGKIKRNKKRIINQLKKITCNLYISQGWTLPHSLRHFRIEEANSQLMRNYIGNYVPKVYPGKVTIFRHAQQRREFADKPLLGWGEVAEGGVEVREIEESHGSIYKDLNVQKIFARELTACLDKAEAELEDIEQ